VGGVIKTEFPSTAQDSNNECQNLLKQAGADGTGTVTRAARAVTEATAVPTSSVQERHRRGRLSIGVQAAIALGVTIFIMLLAAVILFFRNRRQQTKEVPSSAEGFYKMEPTRDPGTWFNAWDSKPNLDGTERHGMMNGHGGHIADMPDASRRLGTPVGYNHNELPIVR
jgi:hypothetical protein